MITKGFILETLKWKNVVLGRTQLKYLNLLSAAPLTAYDIFLHTKKEIDKKNVRKVLTRLHALGLIELVGGSHSRGAKPYRLTTAGLFQYLLHVPVLPYALKYYEDNILLEMLLYQFLERETLKCFHSIKRTELLNRYLKRCCHAITLRFGQYAHSNYRSLPIRFFMNDLDAIIMREIRTFVFEIAAKSKTDHEIGDPLTSKREIADIKRFSDAYSEIKGLKGVDFDQFKVSRIKSGPNFKGLYPIPALSRDKKFTTVLRQIKTDFDDGTKELLYFVS